MMLANIDKMQVYERQLLLVAYNQLMQSPYLNETQKQIIENKFQEIVYTYVSKDFM